MKPPSFFRVLGQRYKVRVVGSLDPDIIVNGHTGYAGAHRAGRLEVEILGVGNDGFAAHQQLETFLHECLHAIVHHGGLLPYFNEGADEKFVDALSPQLLHFMRDNPRVMAFLLGDIA